MADAMDLDTPVGSKRKADAELRDPPLPKRILALDSTVVNKIAAGEIIISPVNALKELVENSIDAKSTLIEVVTNNGGLKFLQITDNGSGIRKDDLEILCVRHTTSKLSDFSELSSISSYGFRGEALASISHIAHLTVTTRTHDSDFAWRAHYLDGKLVPPKPGQSAEPKMVAGKYGTQFTIEDMFFNIPIRLKAFRSPGEEYTKIVDMLGHYAIHCEGIGFSCKKQGDASPGLSIQATTKSIDRIRQIIGSGVANELIEFGAKNDKWGVECNGWATNANYHGKKTKILLFVNHRLVESNNIKKALEQMYSAFLPKGSRPFVYLNLAIRPDHVDVNLHPTKRVVGLVHEDEITQVICEHIRGKLAEVDHSRTFATSEPVRAGGANDGAMAATPESGAEPKRQRRNSNTLVRTDAASQKITGMFPSATPDVVVKDGEVPLQGYTLSVPENVEYAVNPRPAVSIALVSISELRKEIRDDAHEAMTQMMEQNTFVGIIDESRRLAAIQSGITLYLVDYGRACYEYIYQLALTDFGNFGVINFRPPLDVRELLDTAVDHNLKTLTDEEKFDKQKFIAQSMELIVSQREMLSEYFALEVTPTGELKTLPLLIRGYTPPLCKLPQLLFNLGGHVDWSVEKPCLEQVLSEISSFYVPEELPTMPGSEDELCAEDISDEMRTRRLNVRWAIEHIFFPAFKQRMIVTRDFAKTGMWEMANLKDMYRTFERC